MYSWHLSENYSFYVVEICFVSLICVIDFREIPCIILIIFYIVTKLYAVRVSRFLTSLLAFRLLNLYELLHLFDPYTCFS